MTHLDRVAVDAAGRVFASFKRFFVLEDDDRGVLTPGTNATGPDPTTLRWRALDRSAWPAASKYAAGPAPPPCATLEARPKRFLGGPGFYCGDYDAVSGSFGWRCAENAVRSLVLDDGLGPRVAPLLGWHGNGHAPMDLFFAPLSDLCHAVRKSTDFSRRRAWFVG